MGWGTGFSVGGCRALLRNLSAPPISSETCRVESLQGLLDHERADAAELTSLIEWVPVVEPISIRAGELGRRWMSSHSGIGAAPE
ncbi:PIN domain-containing protein [Marisediminicola antarctica]